MNLLPILEKKRNVHEYWARLGVVFFVVLGVVFLFGASMVLPSYFLIESKLQTLSNTNEALAGSEDALRTTEEIEEMAREMELASELPISGDIATHMRDIINARLEGITLSSLFFQKEGTTSRFTLAGVAATRADVVAFTTSLEEVEGVEEVKVPISNFAQNQNISFSIAVTLATHE